MAFEDAWRTIRERLAERSEDEVLVTPDEERVFVVEEAGEGWLEVRFRDGDERILPREQFRRLDDRLREEALELDSLPSGVDPYVTVLTLAPEYVVDGGRLRVAGDEEREASEHGDVADAPFVRSRWDVRRPPARLHDDALLLAEELERREATELADLDADALTDLYVLLSDVQRGADDYRRDVGNELLDHVGPDGRHHGNFGTVTRARRERRRPKDDEVVLDALDDAGVPHEWVLGVDPEKLDVVVATTAVDEEDVYDVSETYYAQKTAVESDAKRSRLEGLKERLAAADGEATAELRDEIEELEDRIDEVLSTA